MIQGFAGAGTRVLCGFATTAEAFHEFLRHNEDRIQVMLAALDVSDVPTLLAVGHETRGGRRRKLS